MASAELNKAFSKATLGHLTLRNRFIKAATFEGKTPQGKVTDDLIHFHKAIGEGGIGMTTLGYCTVDPDGRINENMLYIHNGVKAPLSKFVKTLHATGAKVSGQMTHCGNFSKNKQLQYLKRPLGASPQINNLGIASGLPFAGAMKQKHIDYMIESYYRSALLMKEIGFDAVEIHFGHGYGLSQFISPKTNRRSDKYGGSLTNRMRLPMQVLEAVRRAVGDGFPILGKMGLTDGIKDGLQQDEAIAVASMLDKGGIDALITSGGTSSFNVMKMFRGPSIATGMIEYETNPVVRTALKLFASKIFKHYPYHELYFLDGAKRVRDVLNNAKVVYIGGCSTLESIETVMSSGLDFIQMGRPLIKNPNFVKDAQHAVNANTDYNSGCIHCNRCVGTIDSPQGIHCPLT